MSTTQYYKINTVTKMINANGTVSINTKGATDTEI
jgi:hypothetical protein